MSGAPGRSKRNSRQRLLLAVLPAAVSCAAARSPALLDSECPIHLEESVASTVVQAAEPPTAVPGQVDWTFDGPEAGWQPLLLEASGRRHESVTLDRVPGALRMTFPESSRRNDVVIGGIEAPLDGWDFDAWGVIVLLVRGAESLESAALALELDGGVLPSDLISTLVQGPEVAPACRDAEECTYVFPVAPPRGAREDARWTRLGVVFVATGPSSIDILSVSAIPADESLSWASILSYREPYGISSEHREGLALRTLYAHIPARFQYRCVVPPGGRLDLALGVVREDLPVTFRIAVAPEGRAPEVVLDETYRDSRHFGYRHVDLSRFAGSSVELSLEAKGARDGTIALFGAPTLSGGERSERPNVILYVIDGGGADFMSVYGYERETTPRLEELAREGAVFERAFSNSTWTVPSTASFVTSLHHSVLGAFGPEASPIPSGATTIAGFFHAAGYQTAAFTSNPNAGRILGPLQGSDALVVRYGGRTSLSSETLHEDFRRFRELYPAEPYWAHFQTTDVHPPYEPVPPFAGRFLSTERRAELAGWRERIQGSAGPEGVFASYREELSRLGIDPRTFYEGLRGLYDEVMLHQDHQLGRFVDALRASGAWRRTLLIVTADHGHPAGSFPRFGRGLLDPEPPDWEGALLGSHNTRVPLMFVWPARIRGGQRFEAPVSLVDLLPTVLDLVGLPPPELTQGQSLAPLLVGEAGFEPRPVIFDEFGRDPETGELVGHIEMIDGRWGASLDVGPSRDGAEPRLGRHAIAPSGGRGSPRMYFPDVPRLLLYDLSSDPYAVRSVNESYPALVEEYAARLRERFRAHRALARRFEAAEAPALTQEELEALRSLGYLR